MTFAGCSETCSLISIVLAVHALGIADDRNETGVAVAARTGSSAGTVLVAGAAAAGARRPGVASPAGGHARRVPVLRRGQRRRVSAADAEVAKEVRPADEAAGAAVERIEGQVGADAAADGLPGRAWPDVGRRQGLRVGWRQGLRAGRRQSLRVAGADEADVCDVGALSAERSPVVAAERRAILATRAALGIGVTGDAEEEAGSAEAVGVAGLAVATAAGPGLGTFTAIAHTRAQFVLAAEADAARLRGTGFS